MYSEGCVYHHLISHSLWIHGWLVQNLLCSEEYRFFEFPHKHILLFVYYFCDRQTYMHTLGADVDSSLQRRTLTIRINET